MTALGDEIVRIFSVAAKDVLIVAPFIGSNAFARLVSAIPPGVESRVVTRWRPEDVLSGVSDLRTLDVARERDIPLYLRNDLHAKLYVADNRCLVGSANVTDTALGWRMPSNLELLVSVDRNDPSIKEFIDDLFQNLVLANDRQREILQRLLDDLQREVDSNVPLVVDANGPSTIPMNWVPTIKKPEDLYALYSSDENRVLRSAIDVTRSELERFCVPHGLNEAGFRSWIGAVLSQMPIIEKTISHIEDRLDLSENVFRGLLSEVGADIEEYPVRDRMVVIQRWLEYFLAGDYELVADAVRLVRSRRI